MKITGIKRSNGEILPVEPSIDVVEKGKNTLRDRYRGRDGS